MGTNLNTVTSKPLPVYKKRSQGAEIWRRFRQNRNALLGMGIFLFSFHLLSLPKLLHLTIPFSRTMKK